MLLHNLEKLDDDLGAWSDQDLALASFLGVVDTLEGIVENGSANHFGGRVVRFLSRDKRGLKVSAINYELVFRCLEREECPIKGSSARVARDESITDPAMLQAGYRIVISHLRPAEEGVVDIPRGVLCD